ncbi:DNA replication complex GINS family protein [Candidatus Woesearchaeota archaeon]|nr:DNA replication complex GINS family protein [Candidatus Woesearchaeota archaeon]
MDEIKVTLETLYDMLRNEKKREDLQQVDGAFYLNVVTYLREKKAILEQARQHDNIFAAGDREKTEYELRSIQRILREIYEKREKKIIDIALNKSKTGSEIIDISAMLPEEKEFYDQILSILDKYRSGILQNLLTAQLPSLLTSNRSYFNPPPKVVEAAPFVSEGEAVRIRFTHPTPKFIWKDLKNYGPFDAGEETEIYPEVADLLVRKGRAVKV